MFTVIIFFLVEGTKKTTVTDGSREQTTSVAPERAGNTGTTSTPSTLTKTGPPAAGTLSQKAGTTSQQTTPTATSNPTTSPSPTITTTSTTITIMMTTTSASQPKVFLVRQSNKRLQMEQVCLPLLSIQTLQRRLACFLRFTGH